MTKYEMMDEILQSEGGYLLTSSVQKAGITRTYLAKFVRERELRRVQQGVYMMQGVEQDHYFLLQHMNHGMIYSHETALYLHGLVNEEPQQVSISVKQGYNATNLTDKGLHPYYVRAGLFETGVTEFMTRQGHQIRLYDMDRTICDIVKRKNEMDIRVFRTALKNYAKNRKRNTYRLMLYARLIGVEEKVREYMEVL